MGAQMDRLMGLARYQVTRMKDLSDKFHLLNEEPECVNVCFWYIPKRFRGMELNKEVKIELGKVLTYLFIFSQKPRIFAFILLYYSEQWKFQSSTYRRVLPNATFCSGEKLHYQISH